MKNIVTLIVNLFLTSFLFAQPSGVDFSTEVYPIFSGAGCTGCHGSNGGFTIGNDAVTAYDNLLNQSPGSCGNTYIVPNDLAGSFVYEKISGAPSCGARMPRSNQSYFDDNPDKLEIIRVWIEEGALFEPAVIGIEPDKLGLSNSFSLGQNYPNPFNPLTNIKFSLDESGITRLIIYDINGREISKLLSGYMLKGSYNLQWDASQVSSGVYFYRLESGAHSQVRKMVLLK